MNYSKNSELANFVLKPNGYKHKQEILNKINEADFEKVLLRTSLFNEELVNILYGSNLKEDIFNSMKNYLVGSKTIIGLVAGPNAQKKLIDITGDKTNGIECKTGTIRNLFTKEVFVDNVKIIDNAIHRSKTPEQAYRDISRMSILISTGNDLGSVLESFSPFKSVSNRISINAKGFIEKTFIDKSRFQNELNNISLLSPNDYSWLPKILLKDPLNNQLVYPYLGERLNREGIPGFKLLDYGKGIALAKILGNIHSQSPRKEIETSFTPSEDFRRITNIFNTQVEYLHSEKDILGYQHGDFSLNNVLLLKHKISIIDWEFSGYGSQKLDLVKLFRTVFHNKSLLEDMMKEYNKSLGESFLTYDKVLQIFLDTALENLSKQEASRPKLNFNERLKYRKMLNYHCIENIKSIINANKINYVEF